MASNEVEVLDPAATVEKDKETASRAALNRRNFMAALGVAGAAAGAAALVSGTRAIAQQSAPSGYQETDVLNLLLQVKYLKATMLAYLTTGADIPQSTGVTTGNATVYAPFKQVTFSTQQITDALNEMYYDDLNQLIELRAIQGTATANRQTVNLLGTGIISTTLATAQAAVTVTQSQAIALLRMIADLSVSAFAGALVYLTGQNLEFAAQAMAVDGFHAAALRLISIQTGAQYQGTQYEYVSTTTALTPVAFTGNITAASPTIYAVLNSTTAPTPPLPVPAVGNPVSGIGLPANALIANISGVPAFTGVTVAGSTAVTGIANITGLAVGQVIVGPGIPSGTTINAINGTAGTYSITLSVAPTTSNSSASLSVLANSSIVGTVTKGSAVITNVGAAYAANANTLSGLAAGMVLSGTGVPANAVIAAGGVNVGAGTVTMSAVGSATTAAVTPTGVTTSGSNIITTVSSVSGLYPGQTITGTNIPASTTITAVAPAAPLTITMSAAATATSVVTPTALPTGIVTANTNVISGMSATAGIAAGFTITDADGFIPAGTTVTAVLIAGANGSVSISANATGSSVVTPTGTTTSGSSTITAVSSLTGVVLGEPISATGIPAGATITAIGATTLTISSNATASGTAVKLTIPAAEALTVVTAETLAITPALETITAGSTIITLNGNATASGINTVSLILPDPLDVIPADPGSASAAASGPAAVSGSSPVIYQGFFNTAGASNSSANNPIGGTGNPGPTTPPGFAFARTLQQVLAVLYQYNATTSTEANQNFEGGFYPYSVSGTINSAT